MFSKSSVTELRFEKNSKCSFRFKFQWGLRAELHVTWNIPGLQIRERLPVILVIRQHDGSSLTNQAGVVDLHLSGDSRKNQKFIGDTVMQRVQRPNHIRPLSLVVFHRPSIVYQKSGMKTPTNRWFVLNRSAVLPIGLSYPEVRSTSSNKQAYSRLGGQVVQLSVERLWKTTKADDTENWSEVFTCGANYKQTFIFLSFLRTQSDQLRLAHSVSFKADILFSSKITHAKFGREFSRRNGHFCDNLSRSTRICSAWLNDSCIGSAIVASGYRYLWLLTLTRNAPDPSRVSSRDVTNGYWPLI